MKRVQSFPFNFQKINLNLSPFSVDYVSLKEFFAVFIIKLISFILEKKKYSSGDSYEGNLKDGKREGYGNLKWEIFFLNWMNQEYSHFRMEVDMKEISWIINFMVLVNYLFLVMNKYESWLI